MKTELTQERLESLLSYESKTGSFIWKCHRGRVTKGSHAGSPNKDGYLLIRIDGDLHMAHRLAWLITYGCWPKLEIDHINGIRSDNRITNLRDVSRSTNIENQSKAQIDSKSGLLGVSPSRGMFRAAIRINGKQKHLGYFHSAEQAHEKYKAEKRIHHIGVTI